MDIDKKLISAVVAAYPVLYDVYYSTSKHRLDILEIPTTKIRRYVHVGGSVRADYGGVLRPLNGLYTTEMGAQNYISREHEQGYDAQFDRTPEGRAIIKQVYDDWRTRHGH